MNRLAWILLLPSLAGAQPKPAESASPRQAVYEFKNVNGDRASEIVNFARAMDHGVLIDFNGPFKTAIVHANGNNAPDVMAKTLELLRRYDVAPPPPPRVEFVAYLVWASLHYGSPPGQPIPGAIEDAVAEMKKNFPYTDYKLLDSVSTEVRHHSEVENMLPGTNAGGNSYFYTVTYGNTNVSADGKIVSVDPFKFSLRIPAAGGYQSTGVTTDLALHEGQKLVIGKVRTGLDDSVVIFLILTVKLH